MKNLLPFALLAALLSGCCCPDYYRHKRDRKLHHEHTTPLPPHAHVPTPVYTPPTQTQTVVEHTTVTQQPTAQTGDIELKTEDLTVSKQTVQGGAARIRRWVVSDTARVPVVVCHEELIVERIPANGHSNNNFITGEIDIPVTWTKEVATPVVTPRVTEILRVRKVDVCETNVISAVVRTEKAEVIR